MIDWSDVDNEQLVQELHKRLTPEAEPDPTTGQLLARQFASMYDEGQADFFEEVARIFDGWDSNGYMQQLSIAGHMVKCECVTEVGRRWVHDMSEALRSREGKEA